jgi:predicted nucleic acid-binding protein
LRAALDALGELAVEGRFKRGYPIELADVERAQRVHLSTTSFAARDAIHMAVMQGRDIGRVMSFDRASDGIPGIVRLGA